MIRRNTRKRRKVYSSRISGKRLRKIFCSEDFSFELPHDADEDVFVNGVDSVLRYIENYVYDTRGVSVNLNLTGYTPGGGDEAEFGYKITFEDNYGNTCSAWVAFRSPDESGYNWAWDGDVFDRNDELTEMAEMYCEMTGI